MCGSSRPGATSPHWLGSPSQTGVRQPPAATLDSMSNSGQSPVVLATGYQKLTWSRRYINACLSETIRMSMTPIARAGFCQRFQHCRPNPGPVLSSSRTARQHRTPYFKCDFRQKAPAASPRPSEWAQASLLANPPHRGHHRFWHDAIGLLGVKPTGLLTAAAPVAC